MGGPMRFMRFIGGLLFIQTYPNLSKLETCGKRMKKCNKFWMLQLTYINEGSTESLHLEESVSTHRVTLLIMEINIS